MERVDVAAKRVFASRCTSHAGQRFGRPVVSVSFGEQLHFWHKAIVGASGGYDSHARISALSRLPHVLHRSSAARRYRLLVHSDIFKTREGEAIQTFKLSRTVRPWLHGNIDVGQHINLLDTHSRSASRHVERSWGCSVRTRCTCWSVFERKPGTPLQTSPFAVATLGWIPCNGLHKRPAKHSSCS